MSLEVTKKKKLSKPKAVLKSKKSSQVKRPKSTSINIISKLNKCKSKEKRIPTILNYKKSSKKFKKSIRKKVEDAVERAKNDWTRYLQPPSQEVLPEPRSRLEAVENNDDDFMDLLGEAAPEEGAEETDLQMINMEDSDGIAEDEEDFDEEDIMDEMRMEMEMRHGIQLRPVKQNQAPREGNSSRQAGSGGRNEILGEEMPGDSELLQMVSFMLSLRTDEPLPQPTFPGRQRKSVRKQKRKQKLTLEDLEDLSDEDEDFKGPSIKKGFFAQFQRRSKRLEKEKMKRDSGEYYHSEEEENLSASGSSDQPSTSTR